MKYFLLFTCSFLYGCMNASVYSDYDRNNDFSRYKTFAWSSVQHKLHKKGKYDNVLVENNIRNYVNKELESRGYTVDINNPDIILDFDIIVEKRIQTVSSPVYRRYGYGMPYQVGTRVRNIHYREGTVVIDVTDRNSNQLVWKGWSESSLSNPQSFSAELPKDIHAIFKKYPVRVLKKNRTNNESDAIYK